MAEQQVTVNGSVEVRLDTVESTMADMVNRMSIHERTIFGGVNQDTGERVVGVMERMDDVVVQLKAINKTLADTAATFRHFIGKFFSVLGQVTIIFLGGMGTVTWFVITHWHAIIMQLAAWSK